MTSAVRVLETPAALFDAAAAVFTDTAREAVHARGRFMVALSGGTTPRGLYSLLAQDAAHVAVVPWSKTHFFWSDERLVPPDHPESNFRVASDAMLDHVPTTAGHVHRITGEGADAERVATDYEQVVRAAFQIRSPELPRFDLVLLGLGTDGHTASLFPGGAALDERLKIAVAARAPVPPIGRITFTVPVINHAARVMFLVEGAAKAEVLEAVVNGPYEPLTRPAQFVRPSAGELIWLADRAAARRLATKS